jgi:hypothetical protein
MPQMKDKVATFLGGTVDKQTAAKLQGWTFRDLKALSDAFEKLPPRKRKQAKAMCCCSMCCCAAAVTYVNGSEQPK